MGGKSKRDNIYFRQTPRQFRSDRQSAIHEHFNKNLPYRIYAFSKKQFVRQTAKMKAVFNKISFKIPSKVGKIRV